ncbi:MAG: hypothetical protein ABI193_26625, partial [Minicystis sp.]
MTLDEVFAAAAARAASLVPETSGYLALAIGDASSRLPLSLDERTVLLTTEGSVTLSKRGEVVSPRLAAKAMRDLLARLLSVSSGTMPGLAGAARPRDESERGVDAVVDEIEAALIPVNRAAARRALARLSRETLRAKEAGKLRARPTQAAKAAPTKAPEPVAAKAPRERTPIPPPELVATPSAPNAPIVEVTIVPRIEHDLAPLLAGPAESVAPPASVAAVAEPLPKVMITEPAIAAAPVEAPIVAAPIVEAPIVEAPVVEAPIVEAPIVEAPIVEVPIAAPIEIAELPPEIAVAEPEAPALLAELAEPTPTVIGMAIEIDDAATPIDAAPVMSCERADDEVAGALEPEAPLAVSMPVTTSAAPSEMVVIAAPIAPIVVEAPVIALAPAEPVIEAFAAIPSDEPFMHTLTPVHVIEAAPTPIAAEVIAVPIVAQ